MKARCVLLAVDHTGPFGYTVPALPVHRVPADGAGLGLVAVPPEATGEDAGLLVG